MILKSWWQRYSPYALIGLAGIARHESRRARVCGRVFSYITVLVSILILWQWQLMLLTKITSDQIFAMNFFIWAYFCLQFVLLWLLVKNKLRFVTENWLLLLIVLAVLPYLFFPGLIDHMLIPTRPVLAIYFMIPTFALFRDFLVDGKLRTTLLAAAVLIFVFGILVSGVDPAIKTPWDGLWWALSTVSTVGYGDVVPTSALGRLLGTGLVILGLGVFVVITANFLALFLSRKQANAGKDMTVVDVHAELKQLQTQQDQVLEAIKKLQREIANLRQEK